MWGVIPAVCKRASAQPLAFSKELLPVGSRVEDGVERPRAVSEYLVERMIRGGATKLCFVISPDKTDVMTYYGGRIGEVDVAYVVQPEALGVCDAVFRAHSIVPDDEAVLIGTPDSIWFPHDGLALLPDNALSFLLFPSKNPVAREVVVTDSAGRVQEMQNKRPYPRSAWVWGGIKLPPGLLRTLHLLWSEPRRQDEHLGGLINAYLARGGRAWGVNGGETYVNVDTHHGYREALRLLDTYREPRRVDARASSTFSHHQFAYPASIPCGAGSPLAALTSFNGDPTP